MASLPRMKLRSPSPLPAALLSLFDQDTPSPTLLSYLHQAVAHPKPLLRTGHLARVTCTSSLPLPHLNAVLGVLNASLRVQRTNGSGIADVFEAKGAEEVLNGMELLCAFVLRGAGGETGWFLADLIEHPPIPIARREAGDEHSARLQEVIETVLGKQVELGLEEALVSSLRGLARTLSGQSGSMLRQQVKVEVGEVTWVESDTWLAVYEMVRPFLVSSLAPTELDDRRYDHIVSSTARLSLARPKHNFNLRRSSIRAHQKIQSTSAPSHSKVHALQHFLNSCSRALSSQARGRSRMRCFAQSE